MAQAGQLAGELAGATAHRHPVGDAAEVDITAQSVVASYAHGLQCGGIVDHCVGDHAAGRAFLGAEIVTALQADGGGNVVIGRAAISAGLAVLQGQIAVGIGSGDGGVDMDVVVRGQGQGGGGVPGDGGIDVDIAVFAAGGHGLQGDAGGGQVAGQGVGADTAVSLRGAASADGKVGGVDQPGAGLAVACLGRHLRTVSDLHMGTTGVDKTTIAAVWRAGIEGAGHLHGAAVEAAEQNDLAVLLAQGAGLDHAGVVDHGLQQSLTGIGGEQHLAAVSTDQLVVFHQGVDHRLIDLHVEQAIAGKIQGYGIAGGQGHAALIGDDYAVVAHRAAEQGDAAAVGCAERAVVDDAGVAAIAFEAVIARREVAVADVQRGGYQAADVDAGTGAEQHAVGVDDKDLTIGVEVAHDRGAVAAEYAVERHRTFAGLVEGHAVAGGDIETLPVDGELAAGLVDDHLLRAWRADAAAA